MEIITVHENILKGLNHGIEKMPSEVQNKYTQRFINFLNNEYYIYHHTISDFDETKLEILKDEKDLLDNLVDSNTTKMFSNHISYRMNSERKLISYLTVLQNVNLIKEELIKLLSSRDHNVQKLALGLLSKSDLPGIKKYIKTLEAFVSDTEFKEEISYFSLEEKLTPEHRPVILPLIIRILIAKLHKKVGKSVRKTLDAKRSAIYRFLASISSDEFSVLINLIIEPFKIKLEDISDVSIITAKLSRCNFRVYEGYVASLEGIIRHFGTLINEYLPILFTILISIYKLTKLFYASTKDVDKQESLKDSKMGDKGQDEIDSDQEQADVGYLKRNTMKR